MGEWKYSSTSAVDAGELSVLLPGRFTHWVGGWVSHRTGLDEVAKRKESLYLPDIEPRSSSLHKTNQNI